MGNRGPVRAEVLAPARSAFTDGQMPWGDVAFEADLAASVLGDLVGTPALYTGDVELVKSAGGRAVMITAENRVGEVPGQRPPQAVRA